MSCMDSKPRRGNRRDFSSFDANDAK